MKGARLRRRVRVNVDVGAALNLVGSLLRYFSLAFVFPTVVAIMHSETPVPFLVATAITAGTGVAIGALTKGREHVGVREGFLVVSLTWLLGAAAVSLPYLSEIERGTKEVSSDLLAAVAGALDLTLVEVLERCVGRLRAQMRGGSGIQLRAA